MSSHKENNENGEQLRRDNDMELSFMGFKYKGTSKTLNALLSGTFGMIALVVVIIFHHYTNDALLKAIHEAIWVQTWTLATAQEDRIQLLQRNASKAPEAVREKIERRKMQGEP